MGGRKYGESVAVAVSAFLGESSPPEIINIQIRSRKSHRQSLNY